MLPPLFRSCPDDAARHGLAWACWPADLATPVALFSALRRAGHQVCLLESVEGPERLARYSFLGVDPVARFRSRQGRCELSTDAGTRPLADDARVALREATAEMLSAAPRPPVELPPFCGGWVGYFGYEWASSLEPCVPRAGSGDDDLADIALDLYRDVLAVDHGCQRLVVMTPARDMEGFEAAQRRIDELARHALALPSAGQVGLQSPGASKQSPVDVVSSDLAEARATGTWVSTLDARAYEEGVARLRQEIGAGEVFQAVLSRRFSRAYDGDALLLYRALRLTNPSPHMFYFETEGLTLVGSSPERLLSVRGRRAEVQPIAGTRPRGRDAAEDERLAGELRADVKERAEHDMLVDLGRNDLGRVARIGTVTVREYAVLQRFARVQHLVSRVDCELAADKDALDALAASFPAGTVSGAPKIRAMQLLAAAEPEPRGPYGGCFGYIDGNGALDMALIIRTFVLRDGELSVQAGAGVVFDSRPAAEEQETRDKAQALLEAAATAASPAFGVPLSPLDAPTSPGVPARPVALSAGEEIAHPTKKGAAR